VLNRAPEERPSEESVAVEFSPVAVLAQAENRTGRPAKYVLNSTLVSVSVRMNTIPVKVAFAYTSGTVFGVARFRQSIRLLINKEMMIQPNALALEYQLIEGSARGDLNVSDLAAASMV
jgi:hypothetical protein